MQVVNGRNTLRVLITVNCQGVDASAQGGLVLGSILSGMGHTVLMQTIPGSAVQTACRSAGLETCGPGLRGAAFLIGLTGFHRLLGRFRPDVVCATRADGQTASAMVGPQIPLVRVRCDIRTPRGGRLWSVVDRRTDLLVFPSRFMVSRGYQGPRGGQVAVIPYPVDTARFSPGDTREEGLRPLLISLARLSPVKGHRTLIRALTLLPDNVEAVIAGAPSQQSPEELMDYADELGVAQRLTMAGRLDRPEDLLAQGGIGVVTSLGSEVVSRAGMEMMSCGLPLLAAATNGLCDLVTDGETGLLHSPGDHRQLAAQAGFLLDNPSAAWRMGGRARRNCAEVYGLDVVGRLWVSLLESLIAGEHHPVTGVPRSGQPNTEGM